MLDIDFDDQQLRQRVPAELYNGILQRMFADDTELARILLSELPGGHTGMSSIALLLAYRFDRQGSAYNPLVLRFGAKDALAHEHANFERSIAERTGVRLVQQRRYETSDTIAVIAYDYLRSAHGNQPLKTLREFLWRDDRWTDQSLEAACGAVRTLFLDTLAQRGHRQPNGWYNDGRLYDDQRPLWFYNTVLPPTITLDAIELPRRRPAAAVALADAAMLARADQPESRTLVGTPVYLQTNSAFPYLELIDYRREGDGYRLRLYLYEGQPIAPGVYQPLQPIAARIDLIAPPDHAESLIKTSVRNRASLGRVPVELGRRIISGRVAGTRYGYLDERRRRLPYQRMMVDNPLRHYHALLFEKRPLTTSIIHGDMNLSNILLNDIAEEAGRNDRRQHDLFEAWLIDFDKTNSGGHTIFDAVKLETEYKIHILPHRLQSFDDLTRLERALHQALVHPDVHLEQLKDSPRLLEAYRVIANLRRTFLLELDNHPIAPTEYYLGLLGYGLAALKYSNIYNTKDKKHWLRKYTFAEHLASFAYMSASFAAQVIDDSQALGVRRSSYPRVPIALRAPPPRRPWLVGRDALLMEAERQLLPNHHDSVPGEPRLVVFCGEPRNGRGAVAEVLCVELQLAGYTLCSWEPDRADPKTVDAFKNHVLGTLLNLGIAPPTPDQPEHTSRLAQPFRKLDLDATRKHLIAVLEPPEDSVSFALHIRIDGVDDPELRPFLARLGRELRHTPVVIVTDEPFAYEDDVGLQLEVAPLTRDDVQAYVQNEREPLNQAEIDSLSKVSHGRPGLLKQIIQGARRYQQQHAVTLEVAIMKQDHIEDEFIEEMLDLMDEQKRSLIGLDALLQGYTPQAASDLDPLVRFLGPLIGWKSSDRTAIDLAGYFQQRQQPSDLHQRLHQQALARLQLRHDFPLVCAQIATFYTQQPITGRDITQIPRPYLVARFQALGGQWASAATTLRAFVEDPRLIFTAYCPKILELTEEVYQQSATFDDRALIELAGTCAAYLGRSDAAIRYYRRLLNRVLRASDPDYPQMLARLAQVYEDAGQFTESASLGGKLAAHVSEQHPLHAIGKAREGIGLLDSEPDRAVAVLEAARQSIEATRAHWGDEWRFYAEERVALYDTLAYACAELIPDRVADASEYLKEVRDDARQLSAPLGAMIENNLGYIDYYVRGEDIEEARDSFAQALDVRRRYGDLAGQMRSGQNLANVEVDLAVDSAGWKRAEELFKEFIAVASTIKTADRARIIANYMHVLTIRGAFEQARELFIQAAIDPNAKKLNDADAWLLRNRAALALWEGDVQGCQDYLGLARPLAAASARAIHRIEWAQIALEAYIRLGAPLDDVAVAWVLAISTGERRIDSAEWRFAKGLLAIVRGSYREALEELKQSAATWSDSKYHYRLATIGYWQVVCLLRLERRPEARRQAAEVEQNISSFGETPLRRLLAELRNTIGPEQ